MSKQKIRLCDECKDCSYIGEGDFVCTSDKLPFFVKEDWIPTERYGDCPNKSNIN